MFSRILLASDGSDNALRAAIAAGDLAKQFGSHLTVVHVYSPPTIFPLADGAGLMSDPINSTAMIETIQNAVARRTGKVLDDAGVTYEIRNEVGHPAECVVRVAESEDSDLIVLGSRGHSAIQSFLMGSVSDRVVHHAHCPVLIVK